MDEAHMTQERIQAILPVIVSSSSQKISFLGLVSKKIRYAKYSTIEYRRIM